MIYGNVEYRAAYEFAGGDADFRDAYVALRDVGPGTVRVGQFFEPFSLEQLTSSNNITFLERALPTLFNQMRSSGGMYYGNMKDRNATWAIGVFRNVDDYGNSEGTPDGDDGEYTVTGRLTWAPVYRDSGEEVVHVGLGLSHRSAAGDALRFSQLNENHFGPRVLDTGTFAGDGYELVGLESAWVHGPLALQAEYMRAMTDTPDGADPEFDGYYLEASYFLTGEHRNYSPKSGAFSGITPMSNYGDEGGTGAWQVAARFSTFDLQDEGIEGGKLDDFTLGINWHLNPNTRVMLNYIDGRLDDDTSDGDIEALAMRFQVNF